MIDPTTLPEPRFVEVGARDGLQNEHVPIPLEVKVAFVDALSETGVREIEAGAFVSSKAVPQMGGSFEVFENIRRKEGVKYSALVPNEEGLERALEAEVDKIAVFTAASETFNQHNINCSIAQSIERFRPVVARAKKARLGVRAYISTAFYCPYEGHVKPSAVLAVVDRLVALGVDELSIGDTIGRAAPFDVRVLLESLLRRVRVETVYMHFHDTYGMAVANALTAWGEYKVSGFDSSAGGLGGCPYAPGAGGNVATEDLAFAFAASHGRVTLDFAKLKAATSLLEPHLGHAMPSHLGKLVPKA
ncbi:MAG: hydroxymethylglutaryl-CoA lyase [Elusimicrobia bacterium]|nr:hydroxymethylglutaryl-CoA lyase [Elusimicrobiota bacterium]